MYELDISYSLADAVDYCNNLNYLSSLNKIHRRKKHKKMKSRKPIAIGRAKYDSITEAAKRLRYSAPSIIQKLKSTRPKYRKYRYITLEEYTIYHSRNVNNGKKLCKPIEIKGILYPSIKEAVEKTGMTRRMITYRLYSNKEKWSGYK